MYDVVEVVAYHAYPDLPATGPLLPRLSSALRWTPSLLGFLTSAI